MTVNLWYLSPERCSQSQNSKRDQRMAHQADLVIIGVSVGLALGILIASLIFFGIRWYKKQAHRQLSANEPIVTSGTLPMRSNGFGTSNDFSVSLTNSIAPQGSERLSKSSHVYWWKYQNKDHFVSASGILRYSYKYVDFELCLSMNFLWGYMEIVDLYNWINWDCSKRIWKECKTSHLLQIWSPQYPTLCWSWPIKQTNKLTMVSRIKKLPETYFSKTEKTESSQEGTATILYVPFFPVA